MLPHRSPAYRPLAAALHQLARLAVNLAAAPSDLSGRKSCSWQLLRSLIPIFLDAEPNRKQKNSTSNHYAVFAVDAVFVSAAVGLAAVMAACLV
jgi:hypothetical protein